MSSLLLTFRWDDPVVKDVQTHICRYVAETVEDRCIKYSAIQKWSLLTEFWRGFLVQNNLIFTGVKRKCRILCSLYLISYPLSHCALIDLAVLFSILTAYLIGCLFGVFGRWDSCRSRRGCRRSCVVFIYGLLRCENKWNSYDPTNSAIVRYPISVKIDMHVHRVWS